jgi:hypothetical protein
MTNGAMNVAQRGEQTGQTTGDYTACDRFKIVETGDTVVTTSQSTDVPSGQGFANSLKIDVTTADASLAASDQFRVEQRLEGQDLQHLLYGTSGAKDLTISFWVKSPKTGTHILELRHHDTAYFNNQAYTIASANTWQKVTLTFSGYTTTAFDNDNEFSFRFSWFLMAGSNFTSGTLNSNTWHNTTANRAVGQVNCVDDAANNFYITGVQLEVGSVATEFEHRSFGEELALCQRYYQRIDTSVNQAIGPGTRQTTDTVRFSIPTPVALRTSPSISTSGTVQCQESDGSSTSITSISALTSPLSYAVATGTASGVVAGAISVNAYGGLVEIDAEL